MRTASGYAFLAALSSLISCARADSDFYLQDEWIGDGFFQGWNWETLNDPTHGRVNYVGQAEAQSKNLTYGTVSSLPFNSRWILFFLNSGRREVLHARR